MAGLIQKTFNQAVNRTAFSLALQRPVTSALYQPALSVRSWSKVEC